MDTFFEEIEKDLIGMGFEFEGKDLKRPWGGFWVIVESQKEMFIERYFSDIKQDIDYENLKLSPKILVVTPEKRLSWQYHHRRSEVWRVVKGPVGVVKSPTDEETEVEVFGESDIIRLEKGERHRLIGLSTFGVIAEIWVHEDPDNPSDEEDIVRVQDDFHR